MKRLGRRDVVIDTKARRIHTWRDPIGYCIPSLFLYALLGVGVYFNLVLDALTWQMFAGWIALAIIHKFGNWEDRCIEQLYRVFPPRGFATPVNASTAISPACPAGTVAPSVIQK